MSRVPFAIWLVLRFLHRTLATSTETRLRWFHSCQRVSWHDHRNTPLRHQHVTHQLLASNLWHRAYSWFAIIPLLYLTTTQRYHWSALPVCVKGSPSPHSSDSLLPDGCTLSSLCIYYQIVWGMYTKIEDFFFAVVSWITTWSGVLTETWLDNRILFWQLFGANYSVFKSDRTAYNSNKSMKKEFW